MELFKTLKLDEKLNILESSSDNIYDYKVYHFKYQNINLEFLNKIIQNLYTLEKDEHENEYLINGMRFEIEDENGDYYLTSDTNLTIRLFSIENIKSNNNLNSFTLLMKIKKLIDFNDNISIITNKVNDNLELKCDGVKIYKTYDYWNESRYSPIDLEGGYKKTLELSYKFKGYKNFVIITDSGLNVIDVSFLHPEGEHYYSGDEKITLNDLEIDLKRIKKTIKRLKKIRKIFNL